MTDGAKDIEKNFKKRIKTVAERLENLVNETKRAYMSLSMLNKVLFRSKLDSSDRKSLNSVLSDVIHKLRNIKTEGIINELSEIKGLVKNIRANRS